ncbi:DUF1643 domain-containing protein [Actibacterium sp. 188UL27-1]|uniref:DUF1643 domain-containing protein n=1 Tax=Actibacterium sp. 188UL27-1 TaxID=2786961 RepID=UPI00195673A2|nr:DUF1643 domain-containing protein [Actibacterium sp. 188UL27-1]MBM7068503.1 DUF1643 domain-containing protein [Actibacterium sp. 188UL27-1]
MIERRHKAGGKISTARYSECERYRYDLTRRWSDGPGLTYIMLNPSKATELANDPTIERCERRAVALGFAAFRVCNLFAWRETDPAALRRAEHPVGTDNDAVLMEAARWGDVILCGWGVHGVHLGAGSRVADLLRSTFELHHLGLTKDGHPRHPLYVPYRQRPILWDIPQRDVRLPAQSDRIEQ